MAYIYSIYIILYIYVRLPEHQGLPSDIFNLPFPVFSDRSCSPCWKKTTHLWKKKHISTCTLYLKQNLGNDINMYVQECMLLLKSGHWGSSCLALCCFVIKYVSNTGNRHLSGRSGIATSWCWWNPDLCCGRLPRIVVEWVLPTPSPEW